MSTLVSFNTVVKTAHLAVFVKASSTQWKPYASSIADFIDATMTAMAWPDGLWSRRPIAVEHYDGASGIVSVALTAQMSELGAKHAAILRFARREGIGMDMLCNDDRDVVATLPLGAAKTEYDQESINNASKAILDAIVAAMGHK